MNILTGIVIIIIAICAYGGMRAGLIKTVFSIFSMIITLILTLWLSPMISKTLQSNDKIVDYFGSKVESVMQTEKVGNNISDQMSFIDKLPLPEKIKVSIIDNNNSETYVALAVNDFSSYVNRSLACIIINAITFVAAYIAILIALRVLCALLDIISKLPIINQINKLSGLFVGALQGVIIVWLLFVLLTAFSGNEIGKKAFVMINESEFLSFIYNNNLILKFITNISKILF